MAETYRAQFQDEQRAQEYESRQYAPGTYADLLWRIEQDKLENIITNMRAGMGRIDHLDFACGSGRVAGRLAPLVDASTAIDIAAPMLKIARASYSDVEFVEGDLTSEEDLVPGPFDLITTFRFVLNAEPALRLRAMRALASRLRNEQSLLVFNNHGNPWSHKALMWPYHAVRRTGRGYQSEGNYLTHGQVARLASDAGLRIVERFGYGHMSAKALIIMPFQTALRLERTLAGRWGVQRLGVNQLYIAVRA